MLDVLKDNNSIEKVNNLNLKIIVNSKNYFAFLEMKMLQKSKKIKYKLLAKKNQRIKYLNIESIHREIVWYIIPKEVFHRLVLLTIFNKMNENKTINKLYLKYALILVSVSLIKKNNFPILKRCYKKDRLNR